jgi:hypothetical protein
MQVAAENKVLLMICMSQKVSLLRLGVSPPNRGSPWSISKPRFTLKCTLSSPFSKSNI